MRRPLQLSLAGLAGTAILFASAGAASAQDRGTTFMKVKQAHGSKPQRSTNLFFHGGSIQSIPSVYIVFWGDWSAAGSAQTYVINFFNGVGGSSWANSTTQYCDAVPTGTTQCGPAGTHVTNPAHQLAGTWNDTTDPLPASPTQSQIATEAANLAAFFGGVKAGADYMVFTPSGHSQNGFGTQWCAYHSSSGNLSFAYVPYQPDAGAACGQNFVNAGSAGLLDGFSIVAGHEYGETVTDPFPNGGWLDSRGAENGDKCAWISAGQGAASNVALSTGLFAVQSLWSNAFNGGAGGCVLAY